MWWEILRKDIRLRKFKMSFAAIDDSLVHNDTLWVYAHALVIYEENPSVKVFTATNNLDIYQHESELSDFLEKYLTEDLVLYACPHYQRYVSIWERVNYVANDRKLPKAVKHCFTQAHYAAKDEANRIFLNLNQKLK